MSKLTPDIESSGVNMRLAYNLKIVAIKQQYIGYGSLCKLQRFYIKRQLRNGVLHLRRVYALYMLSCKGLHIKPTLTHMASST